MTKEITIEDLAAEATTSSGGGKAAKAAAEAAEDGDTGKWILELYERLEDDGMLQAIMFGPDALEPPGDAPAPDLDPEDVGGGPSIDAEVVADALEDVQQTVGDLRISQLVKLTRENPGLVDNLLEEHLSGDAAESEEIDPEDLENED